MAKGRSNNPPIPGHILISEGHQHRVIGPDDMYTVDVWGGCQCGAQPPGWPDVSVNATKRWHRQHKADLRGMWRDQSISDETESDD